jgi:hypothetical protein
MLESSPVDEQERLIMLNRKITRRSKSSSLNPFQSKDAAHRRGANRPLRFEVLEERQLLALMPHLVKDTNTMPGGSNPRQLTDVSGTAFFVGSMPTTGSELWKMPPVGTSSRDYRRLSNLRVTGGTSLSRRRA